jgi:putative RNA 2'-phosphotransferase
VLDENGWVSLSHVMEVLHSLPNFRWVDRFDVARLVREGTGDGKKRFQIEDDRVRALYGHSFNCRIEYEPVEPPARLYHGTSPQALETIQRTGLKPMSRQYVHLSPDRKTAVAVGSRHTRDPVVLTVHAEEAHEAGITFYHPEEGIYLADPIPPRFLEVGS